MASNISTEFSSIPIISERVTNLSASHADLVHCPVCGHILWKPVTCSLCENSFCFQCIQIWLHEQQEQLIENVANDNQYDNLTQALSLTRCPFNCSPFKERKCPPLLISILSKLTIECRNKLHGCQEVLFYEQLEKHEEQLCPYEIFRCPGCKQDMFKSMFDEDKHLSKCLYVELECIKCQSVFKRKDKHTEFDCLEKQISSLKQNMITCEQKCSTVFNIQRQRISILDQKITIIGDMFGTDDETDDDQQIDKKVNSVPTSSQLFRFQVMEILGIITGIGLIILFIFTLIIYIRVFIS